MHRLDQITALILSWASTSTIKHIRYKPEIYIIHKSVSEIRHANEDILFPPFYLLSYFTHAIFKKSECNMQSTQAKSIQFSIRTLLLDNLRVVQLHFQCEVVQILQVDTLNQQPLLKAIQQFDIKKSDLWYNSNCHECSSLSKNKIDIGERSIQNFNFYSMALT